MASVAATVASGGVYRHPRIIDRVVDIHGQIFDPERISANPPRLQNYGITADQIEIVRRGMWEVVNDGGGTARRAKSPITEISGKTGTAQFKRDGEPDNHAWFVGFAPYVQPKFAVCVFVQGGKSGGSVAAPIMRQIVEQSLIIYKNRKDGEATESRSPSWCRKRKEALTLLNLSALMRRYLPMPLVTMMTAVCSKPARLRARLSVTPAPNQSCESALMQPAAGWPPSRASVRRPGTFPTSQGKSKRGLFDRFRRR